MNLDSARNRIKIISGVAARILRHSEIFYRGETLVTSDIETIQKELRALELDLQDAPVRDYNGSLGAHRNE